MCDYVGNFDGAGFNMKVGASEMMDIQGGTFITAASTYRYKAYGLNIESEIEIPELLPSLGEPELKIVKGSVDRSLAAKRHPSVVIHKTDSQTLLLLKSTIGADFLISEGQEIRVDFQCSSQLPKIRLAILGYCLTAVLFQRKYLVFHGNALLSPLGAIAICGDQRAGKSTTTIGLYNRGYGVIADDLTVVGTNSLPEVQSGFPRLKLWVDTLDRFNESSIGLQRILPEIEKFSFPVNNRFSEGTAILNSIYILKSGPVNKATLRELTGIEKFSKLSKQIRSYTPDQVPYGRLWVLKECLALADKINVLEIERPVDGDSIDQVVDLIETDQSIRETRE